jgi:hypothetical protein
MAVGDLERATGGTAMATWRGSEWHNGSKGRGQHGMTMGTTMAIGAGLSMWFGDYGRRAAMTVGCQQRQTLEPQGTGNNMRGDCKLERWRTAIATSGAAMMVGKHQRRRGCSW